jgi:outer membrane protein assembly factor BamB
LPGLLPGLVSGFAQDLVQDAAQTINTEVHLHWGARAGVSRYRLQVAGDISFADILFDRVVTGNAYQVNDLPPGRYFWRIAPLTDRLGDFSSAGTIDVRQASQARPTPQQNPSPIASPPRTDSVVTRGGWRVAIGDMARPMLAHLRSATRFDLVGVNNDGVVFALDPATGVALWSAGRRNSSVSVSSSVLIRSRSGLDNVAVLSGTNVFALDGMTGSELWRTTLPAATSGGGVISDSRSVEIVLVDNSLTRLFALDVSNGKIVTETRLLRRVVGGPVPLFGQDAGRMVLAYETGQIEIRDMGGAVIRSGDAGSPATTPPLFVRGRRGDYILVGTRNGLTALTAAELSPLGMVATNNEFPRGVLASEDLDGDGSPEVIMLTSRGRVMAVSAADGKIIWEANAGNESQAVAFADLNGDRVLEVLLAGGQSFALALSGRDGSLVWKDNEAPSVAANHALSLTPRSIIAMPFGSGMLLVAADSSRTSLRAIEFPKGTATPNR